MKTLDALNILSINQAEVTLAEVKEAYRKASKKYHPDVNPAGLATMKAVNEAFETLKKEQFPLILDAGQSLSDYGEALNDALNAIVKLAGIQVEVCGAWVWVSGDTRPHKEALKAAKFLWSRNKQMWYFRPQSQKKRYFKSSCSIEEIRTKYGSQKINPRPRQALFGRNLSMMD